MVLTSLPLNISKMEMDIEIATSDHDEGETSLHRIKELTVEEKHKLEAQNSRLIPENKAAKLEREAKKHWDLFYKRNETKFFKDRRWTTREFQELINFDHDQKIVFLELGCGVGNMVFPLIEEGFTNFFFYACDFSPRAVEFVKSNRLYDEGKMKAFCADLTTDEVFSNIEEASVDIASLIFVLSAIGPAHWAHVASLAYRVLKPGGVVLFRDYGRYDMAQLRFKPGHKIADNFYMRQDGTRSYYFTEEELSRLFTAAGFEVLMNTYVQRRTINVKEGVDVPRIFIQGKYRKPADGCRLGSRDDLVKIFGNSIPPVWGYNVTEKAMYRNRCSLRFIFRCRKIAYSRDQLGLTTIALISIMKARRRRTHD